MTTLSNDDMRVMTGGSVPQSYETLPGVTKVWNSEDKKYESDIDESTADPDDEV